jgi:hypothetical protein
MEKIGSSHPVPRGAKRAFRGDQGLFVERKGADVFPKLERDAQRKRPWTQAQGAWPRPKGAQGAWPEQKRAQKSGAQGAWPEQKRAQKPGAQGAWPEPDGAQNRRPWAQAQGPWPEQKGGLKKLATRVNPFNIKPRHLPTRVNLGRTQLHRADHPLRFPRVNPGRTQLRRPDHSLRVKQGLPSLRPARVNMSRPVTAGVAGRDPTWQPSRIPNRPDLTIYKSGKHSVMYPETLPVHLPQELVNQTLSLVREVGLLKQEMQQSQK